MPLMTFCQSDEIDSDKFYPVQVGEQTWYAMPKERLGRIANKLDSLEGLANLVEKLDSAFTLSQAINFELRSQVLSYEEMAANYEKEIDNKDDQIHQINLTLQHANRVIVMFEKENKKLKQQRKGLMIGGTAITIGLSAAILIIAL